MVAQNSDSGAAAAPPDPPALLPGQPWPLGATCDPDGINFALFSQHAERVELCLFDSSGAREWARLPLPARTDHVWHGRLPGGLAGQVYGYRVHGRHDPATGFRFNAARLLLDPHAREVVGQFSWRDEHFDWPAGQDPQSGVRDWRDNGPWALKARVCDDRYDWQGDRPPAVPLADTVIYETHVRGMTMLHPEVPAALRGTYAGLASAPVLSHLSRLGITAVCLMPVQLGLDEQRLDRAGLRNYWRYNTLAFFVPEPRYAAARDGQGQRDEFRDMVRAFHRAGIEVILDVVYNHTAESDAAGPTLSFRGLDNLSWYRLDRHAPMHYDNVTGCGNTVRVAHPRVLQWLMDSLRYWVEEMHVDGFRFDLAVTLGREEHGFDAGSGFFDAVRQDPVLNRVKLIAEPWDIGPGGYQAGGFPAGWSEWNGRFRDGVRAFWLGHGATRGELARRLCGSSEQFQAGGRSPQASINFVCAHDGFTLEDLVSYRDKHNLANGEDNRDGHDDNLSTNCGVEGPTTDPRVLERRRRLKRALLASVVLAQGVPQLLGGDELGRTQQGNNNAYCQDNAINWFDWAGSDSGLADYVARLTALRREWPHFRQSGWLTGDERSDGDTDVRWSTPEGRPLTPAEWDDPLGRALAMRIAGPGRAPPMLVLMAGGAGEAEFKLPAGAWRLLLDSGAGQPAPQPPSADGTAAVLQERCRFEGPGVVVLVAAALPAA